MTAELPTQRELIEALPRRPDILQLPSPPPRWFVQVVLGLNRLLTRLTDALTPAPLVLLHRAMGLTATLLLGAAARFRLADHLAQGPLTAEELAARTGLRADPLHRVLRGLVAQGVFSLDLEGRFANNRVSETLRGDVSPSLRDFAEYIASESNVRAWVDVDRTLQSGEAAFPRVHGRSVWTYFDEHPYEREVFARSMSTSTQLEAPAVALGYPFGELRRLCDVGGGRGLLLSEILVRHPQLQGVLYDGQDLVDGAAPMLQARGVAGRTERVAGSFFESVPRGCDAYLLKNILHDWDDERCLRILGHVRRAMDPGGRVLIVEAEVLPHTTDLGAIVDLQMLLVCDNGRERSRQEFAELLSRSGFRLARVRPLAGMSSIFEGIAV